MSDYNFNILGKTLSFSQEMVNYVKLKCEYQKKSDDAVERFRKILPSVKNNKSFITGFTDQMANVVNLSLVYEIDGFFSDKHYGLIDYFTKIRNKYISEIIAIFKEYADDIVSQLQENKVYIDEDVILLSIITQSGINESLEESKESIIHHEGSNSICDGYVNRLTKGFSDEEYDMEKAGVINATIYNIISKPVNECFLALAGSPNLYKSFIYDNAEIERGTERFGKRLFEMEQVQKALLDGVENGIYRCLAIKMELFEKNGLCSYEVISNEDIVTAASLHKIYDNRKLDEDEEKRLMAETLQKNPSDTVYYYAILDKYFDPNGELQKMADIMCVTSLKTRIENYLSAIYDKGDKSSLESVTSLRNDIIEKQKLFAYEESKAYFNITQRQYFLELSRKAKTMDRESIVSAWENIRDGKNEFVEDKGKYVPDDMCITALSRAFLLLKANTFIDRIKNLELAYDEENPDDTWVFFDNSLQYNLFENKAFEVTKLELPRHEDFVNQVYDENMLASEEVILGYYHYERTINNGSPSMIITDKRIYTTNDKFIPLKSVSACRALKKLLLCYIIIERNDGNPDVQLPVGKELAENLANNINKLLCELSEREFQESQMERKDAGVALNNAKETVSNTFDAAKKGFSKFFKK